jgi:hypothetical protein
MLDGNTDPKPDNQDVTQEWIKGLPEELRSAEVLPTISKFRLADGEQPVSMPSSVVKSYIEAQKKIGQKGVLIPGENASEADVGVFYKALGRPDKPEEYGFKKPENLPKGVNYDDNRAKWFADLAHKTGLSTKQATTLFNEYNTNVIKESQDQLKAVEYFKKESSTSLKKEWGSNFEKNLDKANAAVKLFGGKDFIELLKATGMDAHPLMIKAWERVANRIGEASLVDGYVESGTKPLYTKSKLEQMMKDPRYMGNEYERDPEYIETIKKGWEALVAAEANQ